VSSGIQLIAGLGNPGAEYENTRHNAGAWFVDALADQAKVTLRHNAKLQGRHALAKIGGMDVHLFIPATYMNLSGQALAAVAGYYKIAPAEILVAHDEIDLPPATIRLKFEGGHGGHNGLRDIISHLGTKGFYRLRIGVGHPGNSKDVVDFVLNAPGKAQRAAIDAALVAAEPVVPLLLQGEFQKAMQLLHSESKNE
jgi:PTH1 family peptidyl-tRNA hydrolase